LWCFFYCASKGYSKIKKQLYFHFFHESTRILDTIHKQMNKQLLKSLLYCLRSSVCNLHKNLLTAEEQNLFKVWVKIVICEHFCSERRIKTSVKIYHSSLRNNPEERSYLVVSRYSWNVNLISACKTACRLARSDAIDSNSFPHILCLP
jgi:hypothetical protein